MSDEDAVPRTNRARDVILRLVLLLLLWMAAFRGELASVLSAASEFSDWSHVYSLPIVAACYLWCRREDLHSAIPQPSPFGLLLLVFASLLWFACSALGLFGYLALIAMWLAAAGIVLLAAGRRILAIVLPLLLMAGLCMPLFERSMDRFSIPVQRLSIRTAATLADGVIPIEMEPDGTLTAQRHNALIRIAAGEQRFGFRLAPATALLAMFAVFTRRRPAWQIVLLMIAAMPILAVLNVLRILVWIATAVFGRFPVTHAAPAIASAAVTLVATYLVFATAVWLVGTLPQLARVFYFEDGEPESSRLND